MFDPGITLPSIIIIFTVVFGCANFPEITETYLTQARHWITSSTGWLFILGASFFVIFLLILCVSNLGNIRLGNDDDEPEHSFFSWLAMLFAAGMGIGLMFFGVAEPISHFAQPLHAGLSVNDQAKTAMLNTFFHWGIHAWAIYGVLGLALAYFGFRYHVPLTVRRAFFPILKDKVNGPIGRFIDVVALSCTIFGITTTLGYGALQLAAGFKEIHLIDSVQPSTLVLIILVCTSCSILSAISGVSKGVRYLSEINLLLAFGLMLFVLLAGPTVFTLNAFTENLGAYIANLVPLSFRTFAYDPQNEGWFTSWTVMYWACWITWSPFVGMFIAKISKGRTIREFILGVLLVPTVFNLLWMTVFGNTAIWVDLTHKGILSGLTGQTESMLFAFCTSRLQPDYLLSVHCGHYPVLCNLRRLRDFRGKRHCLLRRYPIPPLAEHSLGRRTGSPGHPAAVHRRSGRPPGHEYGYGPALPADSPAARHFCLFKGPPGRRRLLWPRPVRLHLLLDRLRLAGPAAFHGHFPGPESRPGLYPEHRCSCL